MTTAIYAKACSEIGSAITHRIVDGSASSDLHPHIPLPVIADAVHCRVRYNLRVVGHGE